MIILSNPEYGWIILSMTNNSDQSIDIEFSDVGPITIMELKNALDLLKEGSNPDPVYFSLEPEEASLTFKIDEDNLVINYAEDDVFKQSLRLERKEFIDSLNSELNRVIPLCISPHWTQEVNEKK